MQHKRHLYFVALIPGSHIIEPIKKFKADFAKNFDAPYGLKVIPHITLIEPFFLPQASQPTLEEWFIHLEIEVPAFAIDLDGFGYFPGKNNPVVYVNPGDNNLLKILRNIILRQFNTKFPYLKSKNPGAGFTAHMTVAYRDLSWENFEKAWKVYQNKVFKASFDVKEICLLQHDTKQWNVIKTHGLDNLTHA